MASCGLRRQTQLSLGGRMAFGFCLHFLLEGASADGPRTGKSPPKGPDTRGTLWSVGKRRRVCSRPEPFSERHTVDGAVPHNEWWGYVHNSASRQEDIGFRVLLEPAGSHQGSAGNGGPASRQL